MPVMGDVCKGGSHGRCVPAVREGVMGDVCLR